MRIMLTGMLENGGCDRKQSESAVETLLLDLCELLLPYVLIPVIHETCLFLLLAITKSKKGLSRYTN